MDNEQLQPTIENPFATSERVFKPAKREESHPIKKKSSETSVSLYVPNFFVSQATKTFMRRKLEDHAITEKEIPAIYEIGLYIGRVFGRFAPTISDIQAAETFRSFERIQQIANGEEKVSIMRHDSKNGEVMPEKERIKFWQQVAIRVLEEQATALTKSPDIKD